MNLLTLISSDSMIEPFSLHAYQRLLCPKVKLPWRVVFPVSIAPSRLCLLPSELLWDIAYYLGPRSLISLGATCSFLRDFTKFVLARQYRVLRIHFPDLPPNLGLAFQDRIDTSTVYDPEPLSVLLDGKTGSIRLHSVQALQIFLSSICGNKKLATCVNKIEIRGSLTSRELSMIPNKELWRKIKRVLPLISPYKDLNYEVFERKRAGDDAIFLLFTILVLCSPKELNWVIDGWTRSDMSAMWVFLSPEFKDWRCLPLLEDLTLAIDDNIDPNHPVNPIFGEMDQLWATVTAPSLRHLIVRTFCPARSSRGRLDTKSYTRRKVLTDWRNGGPHRSFKVPPRCSILHTLRIRYSKVPTLAIKNLLRHLPALQEFEWIIPDHQSLGIVDKHANKSCVDDASPLRVLDWELHEGIDLTRREYISLLAWLCNWCFPLLREHKFLRRLAIPWFFIMSNYFRSRGRPKLDPVLEVQFHNGRLPESLEVLALRYCDYETSFVAKQLLALLRNKSEMDRLKKLCCIRLQAHDTRNNLLGAYEEVVAEAAARGIDCQLDLEYYSHIRNDDAPPGPINVTTIEPSPATTH